MSVMLPQQTASTESQMSAPRKLRADQLLVERGLFESRARAQAAIEAGLVFAAGEPVRKASQTLTEDIELSAQPEHPFVSRGGVKLQAALRHFGVDAAGKLCLDVGASTGGFVDVLLRAGASKVYAVDVGTDQLHASLRGNPRVVSMESTDIRKLDRLPDAPSLIVVDVSFISLKLVVPAIDRLAAPDAEIIALVKPQFEAGKQVVRKGVVRDPAVHEAVCGRVADALRGLSWNVRGIVESPIAGGDGNREFLLCAARRARPDASD